MTHPLDAAAASALGAHTQVIALPDDTQKSRLHKTPKSEGSDDVASVGERIVEFRRKHPEGSILTEIEHRLDNGEVVYTARAFVRKISDSDRPDATAHATRSSLDADEVTAMYPQETAETSAISRALRNLGILAVPKKPPVPRKPKESP